MCEAQQPAIALKRVSRVYLSVGAYLNFFYKNDRPILQTFQNRRICGLRYFKPSRTARFHRRTSGYLTFSNVFVDNGLCIRKTGCLVFSENSGDTAQE